MSANFLNGETFIPGNTSPFSRAKTTILQPNISVSLNTGASSKWHPYVGLGYSIQLVSYTLKSGRENMGFDTTESYGGFNLNLGLQYDFSKSLFIDLLYDYTTLSNDGGSLDFSKNVKSIVMLKIGLGCRF